jgi:hypothetical protein
MKQYSPKVGTQMQEFKDGGWVPYSETLFDANEYPGLDFFLRGYKTVNDIRAKNGFPVWTFETYMRKRFEDDNKPTEGALIICDQERDRNEAKKMLEAEMRENFLKLYGLS